MAVAGVMMILAGVLVGVVGKFAADGRITRNGLAGIRTSRSMADDESWRTVHRRALPWTYASAAVIIAGGLAPFVTLSETAAVVVILIATAVCLLLMVGGTVAGHRALDRRRR